MPNIIKDKNIVDDTWQILADLEIDSIDALPSGNVILPLAVYKKLKSQLQDRNIGVWLNSDEEPHLLLGDEKSLPLIAINFPVFSDGRGYSYAHILREQLNFTGDLRAIGDVLRDQLFYMQRVGFSSFAMRADQKIHEAVSHFADFTKPYQAAVDRKTPLFLER
jgi:uncharacterized protein (DUF934 family)